VIDAWLSAGFAVCSIVGFFLATVALKLDWWSESGSTPLGSYSKSYTLNSDDYSGEAADFIRTVAVRCGFCIFMSIVTIVICAVHFILCLFSFSSIFLYIGSILITLSKFLCVVVAAVTWSKFSGYFIRDLRCAHPTEADKKLVCDDPDEFSGSANSGSLSMTWGPEMGWWLVVGLFVWNAVAMFASAYLLYRSRKAFDARTGAVLLPSPQHQSRRSSTAAVDEEDGEQDTGTKKGDEPPQEQEEDASLGYETITPGQRPPPQTRENSQNPLLHPIHPIHHHPLVRDLPPLRQPHPFPFEKAESKEVLVDRNQRQGPSS
jgi:hypothetical protein